MLNKEITCPNCENVFYYWTTFDFVTCQQCLTKIPVEPCTEDEPVPIEEQPPIDVDFIEGE